jgi:hypothetical protein
MNFLFIFLCYFFVFVLFFALFFQMKIIKTKQKQRNKIKNILLINNKLEMRDLILYKKKKANIYLLYNIYIN